MESHSPRVLPQQPLVACTVGRDWIDTFSGVANLRRVAFEINRASKYLPSHYHERFPHVVAIANHKPPHQTQESRLLSHLLRPNRPKRNTTPPLPHKHQHYIQSDLRLSILLAIHTDLRR